MSNRQSVCGHLTSVMIEKMPLHMAIMCMHNLRLYARMFYTCYTQMHILFGHLISVMIEKMPLHMAMHTVRIRFLVFASNLLYKKSTLVLSHISVLTSISKFLAGDWRVNSYSCEKGREVRKMCVYMYVCMCVCVYVCMILLTRTAMYVCMYVCMYVHTWMGLFPRTFT
jgi:hypothetical protein